MFGHDIELWLARVVDLANTIADGDGQDQLAEIPALQSFVERHDVSEVGPITRADLRAVQLLRAQLRPVFDAVTDADAARVVNALIARAPVTPRLTDHDGHDWHLHYVSPGASLAERLAVDCGMALAHLIAVGERERLHFCAAPDCHRVLVDLSRNRSRRYCDARTCGNRLQVAAYRERQRGEASTIPTRDSWPQGS